MAKITRATQTIFGGTGAVSDFGEFGSLALGSPTTTKSPSLIQSLTAWGLGWSFATIGSLIPAYQDMNSVHYLAFYQICYLLQMGIAEYDSGTTYYINSIVQFNGAQYQSLTDANIGNQPDTHASIWKCISATGLGANVASASSMTLGNDGNSFKITGTTSINNITIRPAGSIVNLLFTGALTVNTGGNILLNNGAFVTSNHATLELISDGTNWWEIARSPFPATPSKSSLGIDSGTASGINKSSGTTVPFNFTFLSSPNVVISPIGYPGNDASGVYVTSVSTTGFTALGWNTDGVPISWVAVGTPA